MISRREKLLIRPWEQRRYENHRRKVQSALPAIDVGPPANRVHVSCKLKKQQKESERCNKIEKDNLKMLQRMRCLMSTSRVDNSWRIAPPNFLNRVTIYDSAEKYITKRRESEQYFEEKTRKDRCLACTPKRVDEPKIPEERVPWAPPKMPVARKRSQSLPARQIEPIETTPSKGKLEEKSPKKQLPQIRKCRSRSHKLYRDQKSAQSIILTRGDLHLAVNFPPDTLIKLKDGSNEKFILSGPCHCKRFDHN